MKELILESSSLYIRIILFLAFLGHGFVSLGYSSSVTLHYNMIDAINFTSIDTALIVKVQGFMDVIISFLILLNYKIKSLLYIVFTYLICISISSLLYYWNSTGSVFGIAELFRRLPWIFLVLFLFTSNSEQPRYHYIRIGLSFAFLAHGLASLGFLGLNQGHIDLAMNIVSPEQARVFITYTGITDTLIGFMLLQSIYTKQVTVIAMFWITFIVYLSYLNAWPDAIFRTGFLLMVIYVYLDKRTHLPKLINYEKK